MGFYPVTPGSNTFAIGAPQFPKLQMQLQGAQGVKTLTIEAKNLSETNKYVKNITIDGVKHNGNFFTYNQLMNANHIVFEMTD
jgi:putative alpha-1,2-mannosidase